MNEQSEFYTLLKRLKNGEKLSFSDFENTKDSETISIDVASINVKNPLSTRIKIDFEDKIFDLLYYTWEGEWQSDFLKNIFSHYTNYNFGWYDRVFDDYIEGYLEDVLTQDQVKWKSIVLFVDPNNQNNVYLRDFWKLLYDTFPKPIDKLLDSYADIQEECSYESTKEEFRDFFCGLLNKFNIFSKNCFGPFYTTLGNLLYLYEQKSADSSS